MRLFTRYVLREVSLVFVLALVSLTALLVLVVAVQEAIKAGLGAMQIVQLMPFALPGALVFAVPGSMLFAVSSVYGRMAGANEIVAVKSLGISPMAVLWPTLAASVLLSLTTVWLNDLSMSWGFQGMKRVAFDALEDVAYSVLRTKKSFATDALQVTVMRVEGHTLIQPYFSYRENSKGVTLRADKAELFCRPGSGKLTITCENAVLDAQGNHLALPWLERDIDINPPGNLSPKQLPLFRIPSSLAQQRQAIESTKQRMVIDAGFEMMCGDFAALAGPTWQRDLKSLDEAKYSILKTRLEPPRRWAAGFSCTAFVLVGSTMAIRRRNADALTSFFLCFGPILLVYYPFLAYALDRAKDGAISPYCVWLANGIVVVWGLWLLRRVIRY